MEVNYEKEGKGEERRSSKIEGEKGKEGEEEIKLK